MEGILLCFAVLVLAIGVIVIGYLDYKRTKEETDSRTAMYDNISRKVSQIAFHLQNIDYYFHLYHVEKVVNQESEDTEC